MIVWTWFGVSLGPTGRARPGQSRNPSHAGVVPAASRVRLQVYSVDRARKFSIDLGNHVRPIAGIVEGIGSHMVPKLAEHHSKSNCGGRIKAVLVVKIDGIESRDGGFQRLKILVQDAGWAGALALTNAVISSQSP